MDRDHHPWRRSVSSLSGDRGAPVLALRRDWRNASPLRDRAAAAADRSGPDRRHERVRAEFAGLFCLTRAAFLDHERAKAELKALVPEDAKEATGHGVRARRAQSGAVPCALL